MILRKNLEPLGDGRTRSGGSLGTGAGGADTRDAAGAVRGHRGQLWVRGEVAGGVSIGQ